MSFKKVRQRVPFRKDAYQAVAEVRCVSSETFFYEGIFIDRLTSRWHSEVSLVSHGRTKWHVPDHHIRPLKPQLSTTANLTRFAKVH